MLTVLMVDSLDDVVADDGMVTLREAIEAANNNTAVCDAPAGSDLEVDLIEFDSSLFTNGVDPVPGTITYTAGNGRLEITDDLDIQGPGQELLTIDANGQSGVFFVAENVTATINGLTITDGTADYGGGIYNLGTLTVADSTISENSASNQGGGIRSYGTLTVVDSTISGNMGIGGGIFHDGIGLTVMNSTISENSGTNGLGIVVLDGDLLIDNSVISDNEGDGVHFNGSYCTIRNTLISRNNDGVRFRGGTSSIEGSTITGNSGIGIPDGGDNLTVFDSTVSNNAKGGISSRGDLTVTNSTISHNTSDDADCPGITINGWATIEGSVISDHHNHKGKGGGVLIENGFCTISNTLFSGNSATTFGGGIYLNRGRLTVSDSTFLDNTAAVYDGGAIRSGWNSEFFVSGSYFKGNYAEAGGGAIYCWQGGTGTVVDSVFTKNVSGGHGGAIANTGTLHLSGLTVSENTTTGEGHCVLGGGGISNESVMTIADSTIVGNHAIKGGGIWSRGSLNVVNSQLAGNSAVEGGGAYNCNGGITFTNSTISGNVAESDGGGIFNYSDYSICNDFLRNTIISLNETSSGTEISGSVTSHENCLLGSDPKFVRNPSDGGDGWGDDPSTPEIDEGANDDYGDLRLRPDSTARDAGDNTLAVDADGNPLLYDLNGNPRIIGGTVDIGAFEAGPIIYVDCDAVAGGDGLAWESALNDLQLAMDKAELLNTDDTNCNDIFEIWIAEGTYIPTKLLEAEDARSASFSLLNNVALYGGFEGTETALDQRDWTTHETILSGDLGIQNDTSDNAYTVVYCGEDIETTLDGVTASGSTANGSYSSSHLERRYGGGIFNTGGLTVCNSTITNNTCSSGIHNSGNLTVINTTISGHWGSGITNFGNLIVMNSTISDNQADKGGGILNDGTLVLTNSIVADNWALERGGGIYNKDTLYINNSTISGNSTYGSSYHEYGGGIYNDEGEMTISRSTFSDNSAVHSGGAIANYGNMTVTGSLFQDNNAGEDGGAISNFSHYYSISDGPAMKVSDSTFIGNFAEIGGGGIHNWGKGTVSDSTFTNNTANGHGGAIGNPGTLELSGLFVSGNYTTGRTWGEYGYSYVNYDMGVGGGISNEDCMTIIDSTIVDNFARYGGGVGNILGSLTVVNSTISGNTAEVFGGGVYGSGTTIFHATIIGNVAGSDGGGVYDAERIGNTVIAGNTAPEHPDINVSISDSNFVGTEDGDPMLTAITDEMGRLLYYRPQSGSPLIDAGRVIRRVPSPFYPGRIGLDYDQLGNLRLTDPLPAAVDIGSIELQATPELAVTPSPYFEIHEGESITVDVCLTAVPEGTVEVAIEKQVGSCDDITADLSTILFDATNWNVPQTITVSMTEEVAPGTDHSAVFSLSAPGMDTVRLFMTRPADSRTYVITSLADVVAEDGQVTLREAIEAANTNTAVGDALAGSDSQEDVITFDPALFANGPATITLSGTQLEISDHLTIDGPGEELLTIDANGLSRLFYIDHFVSATLEGLTLTGGSAEDGDAIFGFGISLAINECTISNNLPLSDTEGICFAGGALTINDSTICENSVGITNYAYQIITNSTISNNHLGIRNLGNSTVINSTVSSNTEGGIYNRGNLTVTESLIAENVSGSSEGGGGISNGGFLTIIDSVICKNVAENGCGGGICNHSHMTVTGSTIYGNSTKSGNGGGIYDSYGRFTIINSTICGNSAVNGNGGGVYNKNWSFNSSNLINSTVAGNVAMDGGGIYWESKYNGFFNVNNSIVALNEGGQFGGQTITGNSKNLIDSDPAFIRNPSDGGDGWGDDLETNDIDESANDDYGDLRLRSDSPAIDAGDNALAVDTEGNPLTTDLEGNPRIFGGTVDIGAYESDVNAPPHVTEVTIGQGNGRSAIRRINVSFHEAVLELLNADALQLSNLTTGEAISADAMTVEVDSITSTATLTFPGLPGGRLPDGNYSATILADAVVDPSGNPMAADYTFEFHSFFGDSDGDRDVDFADLFRFRKTYQKTSADVGFDSRFDIDADGDVDTADLFAFRQNYLKALDTTPSSGSQSEATAPILSRMQQAALLPFLTSINTTPPEITYGPVQRPAERGVKVSHDFFASRVGLPEPVSQEPLTANSTLDEGLLTTLAMDLQQRQSNTKKSDDRESEQEKLMAVAYADYE